MTIQQAATDLRARRISSTELVAAALKRIGRLDSNLRAFIAVTADSACECARRADEELAAGRSRGPLHGIPVAVKDVFATRGAPTSGGSTIFGDQTRPYDSAVVERLEASGAILLGKLNLHELAYGITSQNPHFGAVRNPWNVEHSPGGSSGGAGAAVACGMVFAAMGTDTGGSIRIPASFCGTVGLKPTFGRVSCYGMMHLGFSLDHAGPLARSVRDAALILNVIAGADSRDPGSSRRPVEDYIPEEGCSIRGLRAGVPENFFFENLDPEVDRAVRGAIARAESLGARICPVRVPDIAALNAAGRMILLAEASALLEPRMTERHRFGADVLALLDQGRLVAATDYINAQRLRRVVQQEFQKLWSTVDCLMTPTTPMDAPPIGASTVTLGGRSEDVRLAATRLVRAFNALGAPALSMPCGLTNRGLPIGLQIAGPAFSEALILRAGAALEDAGVAIPPCLLQ